MVGDDCEPELHLSLGSSQDCSSTESNRIDGSSANSEQNQQQQQQQQQQITIFYNGRICVCDVTEFQARAIISMAKKGMDDGMKEDQLRHQQQHQYDQQKNRNESSPPQPPASSPQAVPPQLLNQGQSMKRSLQRFLQKRKTRINAASPYNKILFSPTS